MRILDRYVVGAFLSPFLFGVCAFSVMFISGGTVWRIAQYISKYNASGLVIVKLFLYSLPSVIAITLPMGVLLAVLISFARLSGASEVIVMRSCGVPFVRLALPVYTLALIISFAGVVLQERIAPAANAAYNYLVHYEIERSSRPNSQEHVVLVENYHGTQRITYARQFDKQTATMYPVAVQEQVEGKLVRTQQAARAVWQEGAWVMYDGVIVETSADETRTMAFTSQLLPMGRTPQEIPLEQKKPDEMTVKELKQRIAMLQLVGQPPAIYEVEMHQRLAIPLASLVFAFIGAPLGVARHRSSSSIGMSLSVLIIFVFYAIMTYATALGRTGALPAPLAAWLPDMAGMAAGLYLTLRVDR